MICLRDSENYQYEYLSGQTFMFVGTDSGLYYNATNINKNTKAYGTTLDKSLVMDSLSVEIQGADGPVLPYVLAGRKGKNLYTVSHGADDNDSYKSSINMGAEANRLYHGYFPYTKTEEIEGGSLCTITIAYDAALVAS